METLNLKPLQTGQQSRFKTDCHKRVN